MTPARPTNFVGFEYSVVLEKAPIEGWTRMFIFERDTETRETMIADIAEADTLDRLRAIYDEFEENRNVQILARLDPEWVVPEGGRTAFDLEAERLKQEARDDE